MRICHYIKPNARSETPTRAIWLQAWTYQKSKTKNETLFDYEFWRLRRGVKDTNTGIWSFQWFTAFDTESLWNLIDSLTPNKTRTYLFIDNPSLHLPLMEAFHMSVHHGWKLTLAVIPPAPTICRWRKGNKSIVLLGVSNIWPTPFAGILTGATKCSHVKNDSELNECEHVRRIDIKLRAMYSQTVAWFKFLKDNDLGGFCPTAGAQSIRVWRHKFMTHKVLIDCHDDALALARKAMYGAMCQVYKRGTYDGPIYELDTNGSYGGIMRDMLVPVKLRSYRMHCTVRDLCEWLYSNVVVATCDLSSETNLYPVREAGHVVFKRGVFTTTLAGEELRHACDSGDVVDVHEVSVYHGEPAFSTYMQVLWNLRMLSESNGEHSDAERYKLLMASFWGRWAQHGWIWEKVRDAEDDSIRSWIDFNVDTQVITEYRQFGGIVQKLNNETESRESSPAIAACILAGGRLQLGGYIDVAGLDHVYYCDTDALFTDEVGLERLRNYVKPGELGKLKIKGVYHRVTFHGQKHITIDGKLRLAGMSAMGVHTDASTIYQNQSQHLSSYIRAGTEPRASQKEITKRFKT